MPTRFSSQTTDLKWIKRLPPHRSTLSQRNRKLLLRIKKSQHSGCNKNNKQELRNRISTTREIAPEARAFPEQISKTGRTLISQDPKLQETVKFVFTARF
jgi:hypothetical protein